MTASGPIRVKSGETLHGVRVRGNGGAAVMPDPGATGWTIDGFDIEAPAPTDGRDAYRAVSIYVQGGSGTIRNGRTSDTAAGVYADSMEGRLVVEGMHISGVRWNRPRAVGIQLNGCTGGAIIEGCVSDTGCEDHINLYRCVGTADKRFVIRNNWIHGRVPPGFVHPDGDHTGCGINVGDEGGSWFDIIGNVLVMVPNAAIGVGGSNTRVLDNLIFGWGEQSTLTGSALAIRPGASEVYSAGNRALVRSWLWGGKGELGAGYWTHPSVTSAIETGNNWQDQTLTAAIWTPPEIYRMSDPDEKATAAHEDMLAAWRLAKFMDDVAREAKTLASALTAIGQAQTAAQQSVAKDAEQMRAAADKAPAAQKASDIARDAVTLFAKRTTSTASMTTATKAMADCVTLAVLARELAEKQK